MSSNTGAPETENNANPILNTSHLTDPGWAHCTVITADKKRVRCNHCGKEMSGGINRLKYHIARISGDASICPKVSDSASKKMQEYLEGKAAKNKKRKAHDKESGVFGDQYVNIDDESGEAESHPTKGKDVLSSKHRTIDEAFASRSGTPPKSSNATQILLKTSLDKDARKRTCKVIARWFYHSAIPFNAASSIYWPQVVDAIGRFGPGMKAPTSYELGGPFLKDEVQELNDYLGELKTSWIETGCSIMSDGWTDQKGRTLINFLVSNPRGTMFLKSIDASDKVKDARYLFQLLDEVVEEVGEKNVVQVITDNASNYVAAGKLLMQKRKHLFWTPCSAHCIDLIIENIGKIKSIQKQIERAKSATKFIYNHGWVLNLMRTSTGGREILRPVATRFATNFILIESLIEQKTGLKQMFLSEQWEKSKYAKLEEGKKTEDALTDPTFWKKLDEIKSIFEPLYKILRMVDCDTKPAMGDIYNEMLQVKITIVESLGNDERRYKKYWDIIDQRWDLQLHSPLHAAGYFLNPKLQYSPGASKHPEIRRGLQKIITVLEDDIDKQISALEQINYFVDAIGEFGTPLAIHSRVKMNPVTWWRSFGSETASELRCIAIRVLAQNCSSSGCERNWSTFDQIYTKKRNRLKQEKLDQLVFVHYNLRLRERQLRRHISDTSGHSEYDPLNLDNIFLESNTDQWIDDGDNIQDINVGDFQGDDLSWLDVPDPDPIINARNVKESIASTQQNTITNANADEADGDESESDS